MQRERERERGRERERKREKEREKEREREREKESFLLEDYARVVGRYQISSVWSLNLSGDKKHDTK